MALVLPIFLLLVVGMLEFAKAWNLHQVVTDAVREGARRALVQDTAPVDSVYAPMWRYLEQAGYLATYASMGVCNVPGPTNCATKPYPAAPTNFKKTGERMTIELSIPYRIFVLGNRALTMKSSLTVRNE